MTDGPKPGDVWDYPYLWARQERGGETEGRKTRPVAVAVIVEAGEGRTGVVFLAITSQPPGADTDVIEVPETECRRAGLAVDRPLWVVLDEHNRDVAETSYYLEPTARIGAFGSRFRKQMQAAFAAALRARRTRPVRRRDDA